MAMNTVLLLFMAYVMPPPRCPSALPLFHPTLRLVHPPFGPVVFVLFFVLRNELVCLSPARPCPTGHTNRLAQLVHMMCWIFSNRICLDKIRRRRSRITLPILGYPDFTLAPIMDHMTWICQMPMYSPGLTTLVVSSWNNLYFWGCQVCAELIKIREHFYITYLCTIIFVVFRFRRFRILPMLWRWMYTIRHMCWMWFFMLRASSKKTPMFLATVDVVTDFYVWCEANIS